MIDVEDWVEVRRLHRAERLSIKAIVRRTGLARNTVRSALRSDAPPKYERARTASAVDAVESDIRGLVAEFPAMPAVVIAERIGWERGRAILNERVRELRPLFQLVSARYERASMIVTSNKPFGRCGEVFGDPVVAAAMIDRLVHHAEVVSLKARATGSKTATSGGRATTTPIDTDPPRGQLSPDERGQRSGAVDMGRLPW